MKIAIVGSGIAGLAAARQLATEHEVDVFEAGTHVGGHTHTHDLELDGRRVRIDSGFIVFNERTYPGFCALLRELGVASQPSDMGLSVRCERTGLEYNGRNLDTLFAQRRNLFSPSFHRMLRDVLRFHREAHGLLSEDGAELSLWDWLDARGYSNVFRERYLVPMTAAIWSAPARDVERFPARFLARFLANHGMLQVDGRPQWLTVRGGSATYVDALVRPLAGRVHLRTPVQRVARRQDRVEVVLRSGERRAFDHLVLATHSDQALALLGDATPNEREILGAIRYRENEALLHTDARFMPRRRKCWASWNCHLSAASDARERAVAVTYWMNRLQALDLDTQVFVTLNRSADVDPRHVLRRVQYHHPQFDPPAIAAQARKHEIQGRRRTWYCGAYWGFGFHEDGLQSGLDVARGIEAWSAATVDEPRDAVQVRA